MKNNSPIQVVKPYDSSSKKAFGVSLCGKSQNGSMTYKMGQREYTQEYCEICGTDSKLEFTAAVTAENEIILEIFESHDRYGDPFAYFIEANGKRVYCRTYAPLADGANHYFVRIKGNFENAPLKISIIPDCNAPIRIEKIYIYPDALELADKQGINEPMLLGLFSPGLSGDEQEDIRRINECRDSFAPYTVLCGWDIFYCHSSREALHKQLDYILHLSSVTGVAMSFDLNSWWSGTPSGMDGLGGNFRDLEYQQVIYDPQNVTGYGVYQLTTPNYWKSLPWMSLNNEHYNRIRQERLKDASNHIKMRIAQYRAEGKPLPQPVIFTENEPDYWHYGAWHDSADNIVGIEPCALKAAAKDGVIIEPEKGLDENGRAWLWKNLTDYIVGVGNAIAEGIGNDVTVVKGGEALLPDTLLTEHSYTHATTGGSVYPYPDGKHSILLETHIIDSLRIGYQGGVGAGDPRALEYASCYGRLAGVNKEQLKPVTYGILPASYFLGADFQTIFNYKHCFEHVKNAPKPADYTNLPVPVPTYNDQFIRYCFDSAASLTENDILVSAHNMHLATARGSYAVRATDNEPLGSITLRIHSDNGFAHGLITDCVSTVNVKTVETVELGYSPDEFVFTEELQGRHQYINSYVIDWSDRIDRSATDIYIRITMPSGLHSTEYNAPERNSICSFVAYSPRLDLSGHTDGVSFTFGELRSLFRLSERRADACRLMEKIEYSEELNTLFDAGMYQSVYEAAIKKISQKLPADYLVYDNGPLGEFPITVSATAPVRVTVSERIADGFKLRFTALDHNSTVNINGYKLTAEADGAYLLTPADTCSTAEVKIKETAFPERISGRIVSCKNSVISVQSQNTDFTFYANSIPLPLKEDCKLFVAHHGIEGEELLDISALPCPVSATILTDGIAVTEIHAQVGRISGHVTAFTEGCIKGEIKYPVITVSDGFREVTATIGSECAFRYSDAKGSALHVTPIGDLGIELGREVTLTYFPEIEGCPYIRASVIEDKE